MLQYLISNMIEQCIRLATKRDSEANFLKRNAYSISSISRAELEMLCNLHLFFKTSPISKGPPGIFVQFDKPAERA